MMGLLDGGLQRIFGNVFAPFFLAGTLHSAEQVEDGQGGMEVIYTDYTVKAMKDQWRRSYADYGLPRTDAVILILQLGMTVAPKPEDQITVTALIGGASSTERFAIGPIAQDPASAHWIASAKSVRPPAPDDSDEVP